LTTQKTCAIILLKHRKSVLNKNTNNIISFKNTPKERAETQNKTPAERQVEKKEGIMAAGKTVRAKSAGKNKPKAKKPVKRKTTKAVKKTNSTKKKAKK